MSALAVSKTSAFVRGANAMPVAKTGSQRRVSVYV